LKDCFSLDSLVFHLNSGIIVRNVAELVRREIVSRRALFRDVCVQLEKGLK